MISGVIFHHLDAKARAPAVLVNVIISSWTVELVLSAAAGLILVQEEEGGSETSILPLGVRLSCSLIAAAPPGGCGPEKPQRPRVPLRVWTD